MLPTGTASNLPTTIIMGVVLVCTTVLSALHVVPAEAVMNLIMAVAGGALGAYNPSKSPPSSGS